MPNGDVFQTADIFRRELLAREAAAMREMVRAYSQAWIAIREELESTLTDIGELQAAGEDVPADWLFKQNRLRALQVQAEAQMAAYTEAADGIIAGAQLEATTLAAAHIEGALSAAAVETSFSRLPVEAMTDLIGFLGDGSPLAEGLAVLGADAPDLVRDTLIRGLALGRNPREIGRDMRAAFGGNLSRSMRLSRTAILNSYRESTRRHYASNSDIIGGWYWLSALQPGRTCSSCWAMHGTFHANDERLNDHWQGRCTQVPGIKGVDFGIRLGTELFAELSPADQLATLGPSKFLAYQRGRIGLEDLVHEADDPIWGPMRRERSLVGAVGREEARQYYAEAAGRVA